MPSDKNSLHESATDSFDSFNDIFINELQLEREVEHLPYFNFERNSQSSVDSMQLCVVKYSKNYRENSK